MKHYFFITTESGKKFWTTSDDDPVAEARRLRVIVPQVAHSPVSSIVHSTDPNDQRLEHADAPWPNQDVSD